jgi:esterase/lipase
MIYLIILIIAIGLMFRFGPRPRLDATERQSQVPQIPIQKLPAWLDGQESHVPNLVPGAAAHIEWANEKDPQKTPYSFLYLHGFSATWQETAPLTSRLAKVRHANSVHGRLAGHGEGETGMLTPAEHWLQSVTDHFELATRLGEKVIIVGVSTGCTVATWLLNNPSHADKVHACLFLSPNFRIRSPLGFLLTWPLSKHWIHLILGRHHEWEPMSDAQAAAWTSRYSTLALIEMQKTVDFAQELDFGQFKIPLAMMYMENDGTIHPPSAIQVFNRWAANHKELIRVDLDGETEEHVFVGEITAPHRLDWCFERLNSFLDGLENAH